jgi:hypothetical protein
MIARVSSPPPCKPDAKLRAWLEYVVETAIGMLDALDAQDEDLEDDDREPLCDHEAA